MQIKKNLHMKYIYKSINIRKDILTFSFYKKGKKEKTNFEIFVSFMSFSTSAIISAMALFRHVQNISNDIPSHCI